jgi:cellulose synthase/poly-beta-1,6-N-acetylglucosamine synthase-like glycosyltransferase
VTVDPSVSVVITAHNAAGSIGACLRSIGAQANDAAAEIVLVDDRSTDGTSEAAIAVGLETLRILRVERPSDSGLTTRQDALALGFRAVRGKVVVTTDADGIVAPDWISAMTTPILSDMADAVAGPVLFRANRGWLGVWQTIDVAYYLLLNSLLNALGFAGGVLFGNFAFRRELFDAVGGYERIGFTLTEDLAFGRALKAHGSRIRYSSKGGVEVAACDSWSTLVERAKRVSSGGFSALALTTGVWMGSLLILAVLALVFGGAFGWLLLARYVAGAAFSAASVVRVGRFSHLPAALLYEPLAIVIGLRVMARLARSSRVEWGGKSYAR